MRIAISCLLGSAVLVAAPSPAADSARLEARADAVSVPVTRRAGDTRHIALPALEFNLTIDAACPAGARPQSLSVSVADTRRTLAAEQIASRVETTLSLPRRQSALVRIGDFCRRGEPPGAAESLLLPDVFTARLSLRCSANERQSIVYASLPLDIKLECAAETSPDDDQDVSSSESVASFWFRNSNVRCQACSAASAL